MRICTGIEAADLKAGERMKQSILFSPSRLKNYTLKNRIGAVPMTRMSSLKVSIPRQGVLDSLVLRAWALQSFTLKP